VRAPHDAPLWVREIGSFYVGGKLVTLSGRPVRELVSAPGGPVHHVDPNGEIAAGQMYAHYVRLAEPRGPAPVLMWHGGGMCGANWEATPDGREGWQMRFLRAGLDVYVCDSVERGRASWAPYPDVYASEPFFRTAREAWEVTFRLGPPGSWDPDPRRRVAHPGLRFPVGSIDEFMKQSMPRWATNDGATQDAYDALVQRVGESILVAHSQGGHFALQAALAAPDRIRAVVLLDVSGAPDPSVADAAVVHEVPHLFVWGDFLDQHPFWVGTVPPVRRWYEALRDAGVDAEWASLPARGIHGNSHALMMDDNSDQIADLVLDWLRARALLAGG
jgi:pimeloyl-ACP methyl ester carboxylesterase